jgi:hypothetical protein
MSLLPTKYIPIDSSVLGMASLLLSFIDSNDTVSTLWDRVRSLPEVRTFDRYADALTLLFAARIIDMQHGTLVLTNETGTPK